LRLAAELAFGADFASYARHFRSKNAELLNHGVDDVCEAKEFALQRAAINVEPDGFGQVALGNGGDGASHFGGWAEKIVNQCVDRNFHFAPGAARVVEAGALLDVSFFADDVSDALKLAGHTLVGDNDFVEAVGNLSANTGPGTRQADGEITVAHGLQTDEDGTEVGFRQIVATVPVGRLVAQYFSVDLGFGDLTFRFA
jgi:hypothetical protein